MSLRPPFEFDFLYRYLELVDPRCRAVPQFEKANLELAEGALAVDQVVVHHATCKDRERGLGQLAWSMFWRTVVRVCA